MISWKELMQGILQAAAVMVFAVILAIPLVWIIKSCVTEGNFCQ
jgi:ABC-type phosphate/phosphonate transport system permease subunit